MEQAGYYTGMVLGDDLYDDADGLDDLSFATSHGTQENFVDPFQLPEADDELLASPGVQPPSSTKGYSKRSKKFDKDEDKTICSAWLNTSKDPIVGANQNRLCFWGRFKKFFDEHKTTTAVRTQSAVMHRWLAIQHCVNKFCSAYDKVERRNASGATIHDMIVEAHTVYLGLDKKKKSFTMIHCWHELKDQEKWKSWRIEQAEQQKQLSNNNKKQKTTKDSNPTNEGTNNNNGETEDIAAPGSEERKRPKGVKAAKEAQRRAAADTCMEAMDTMWTKKEAFDREREKAKEEKFAAALELEKHRLYTQAQAEERRAQAEEKKAQAEERRAQAEERRVQAEEKIAEAKLKKAEAELLKEEKDIMSVDMSSLTPLQKQWYEAMQKKIVAKHLAN